jgi:hypothetical protein
MEAVDLKSEKRIALIPELSHCNQPFISNFETAVT